jgi:hypothetical protein
MCLITHNKQVNITRGWWESHPTWDFEVIRVVHIGQFSLADVEFTIVPCAWIAEKKTLNSVTIADTDVKREERQMQILAG